MLHGKNISAINLEEQMLIFLMKIFEHWLWKKLGTVLQDWLELKTLDC